jgi:hypothetical protein
MSDTYEVSQAVKIVDDNDSGLQISIDGGVGAGTKTTLTAAQTNNHTVTLSNPTAGQVLHATGASASTWKNPLEVQDETTIVNVANFHTLNFTGSLVTVTDAGGGVADVTCELTGGADAIGLAVFSDVKANGVTGGATTLSTWQTRTLNTSDPANSIVGATLSSNQITLPSGQYYVWGQAPGYRVEEHKIRWRNITDSTTDILGASAFSKDNSNAGQAGAFLYGLLDIADTKVFELQHWTENAPGGSAAPQALGKEASIDGTEEKYTVISIIKLTTQ